MTTEDQRRRRRHLTFGFVLATSMVASRASGASICEGIDVNLEGRPADRWADVIARVCGDLESIDDLDATASIRLRADEDDLMVEVTLRDGRSAGRRVKNPSALRSTLEGLLVLPPSERDASASREGPRPSTASRERARPRDAFTAPALDPVRTETARPPAADLALGLAARAAGAGFLALAPTAEAYIQSGSWLLGLSARWEVLQHVAANVEDYEIDTAGIGFGVARRFPTTSFDIDLGFSPRLIVESQSWESKRSPDSLDEDDQDDTTADVRVATFARGLLGHGSVRPFLGIDAELSPARLRRKARAAEGLPALPAWGVGLSLGLSWSAR